MNEKCFSELLANYLDGTLSDDELVLLKDAVEDVPAYRHRFQNEVRLHTLLREIAVEKVQRANLHRPKRTHRTAIRACLAAAAVLAILLTTALIFGQPRQQPAGVVFYVSDDAGTRLERGDQRFELRQNLELFRGDRISNAATGRVLILLSDGSMASLEGDAELTLPTDPEIQMIIHGGKILLEVVARRPGDAPFRVMTPDSILTVLGTVFSVTAAADSTRLDVHAGKVNITRKADGEQVDVGAGQYAMTGSARLNLLHLNDETIEDDELDEVEILPTDDAFLEDGRLVNSRELKVEGGKRTVYLRFEVKDVGIVQRAILRLKQTTDPGGGTLRFYEGSHNDWSETTLNQKTAPVPVRDVAIRKGPVLLNETVWIDVSSLIAGGGVYTIIMTLDEGGAHDIWFNSKESKHPPVLFLTRKAGMTAVDSDLK